MDKPRRGESKQQRKLRGWHRSCTQTCLSPSRLPTFGAHPPTELGDTRCDQLPATPPAISSAHRPTGCARTNQSSSSQPASAGPSGPAETAGCSGSRQLHSAELRSSANIRPATPEKRAWHCGGTRECPPAPAAGVRAASTESAGISRVLPHAASRVSFLQHLRIWRGLPHPREDREGVGARTVRDLWSSNSSAYEHTPV